MKYGKTDCLSLRWEMEPSSGFVLQAGADPGQTPLHNFVCSAVLFCAVL